MTALETMEIDKLKIEFVRGRLLDSEMKRKNDPEENSGPTSSAFPAINKKAIIKMNAKIMFIEIQETIIAARPKINITKPISQSTMKMMLFVSNKVRCFK